MARYKWTKENHPMRTDPDKFRERSRKNMTEMQRKRHEWKTNIHLTQRQQSIILGSLLGDMSIGMPNKTSKNALIEEEHSIKQIEYLKWKESELKTLMKHEMTTRHVTTGKKEIDAVRIKSMSLPCLTELCKMIKPNDKKEITTTWLNKCDDVSLAVWFMDDGTGSRREVRFAMGDKPNNEIQLAINWMKDQGIIARIYIAKPTNKHITITGKHNLLNLYDRIKPTIDLIPSMNYKLKFMRTYIEYQHFVSTS